MATRAARKRASEGKAKDSPNTPQRWWQWVLVYPALAVSLLTASPQWYDKVRASAQGIKPSTVTSTVAEAEKQARLWEKNMSCSALPYSFYSNPGNVKVDATICNSGDIFVRAVTPNNDNFLKFIALEDLIKRSTPSERGIIPSANAASRSDALAAASATSTNPLFHLAQVQASVLCQKLVDGRYIFRRIQTPEGCFDEVIDTYNGEVVKRNPAPCTPQC